MRAAALLLALFAGTPVAAQVFDQPGHLLFDVLTEADPSGLACLDGPVAPGLAYGDIAGRDGRVYFAIYDEGLRVAVAIPGSLGEVEADRIAQELADALGRVPAQVRAGVQWMAVEEGQGGSTYSGTGMYFRTAELDDLRARGRVDELTMHNAAHVTYGGSADLARWDGGLAADGFVPLTPWAASAPGFDDLAEGVLLGFGVLVHPDRVPGPARAAIEAAAPARLALVGEWLDTPVDMRPLPPDACVEMTS